MDIGPRSYGSLAELRADPPDCDVYLSGSDQIWNPYIFQGNRFDPAFFLTFVKGKDKIAYAPSLGASSFSPDLMWELEGYLSSYKALSARESFGRAVLEQASGRKVETVVDPTLLLSGEDWAALAKKPKLERPYVLCYFISPYGALMPALRRVLEETGLPLVQLAGMRRRAPGAKRVVLDAGPREFLGLFQNAAFVVTNSFHGTVFSMQFEKPFLTGVSPREMANPGRSRIYSLLQTVGLTGRIAGLPETQAWDAKAEYSQVQKLLAPAVDASKDYLTRNLF
ncbi:MAG: polysaccharide pyruvyl transferase family protein [Oscillospiraceae bacterium]|nr:polysaccharide pyruvyl transferase family protein [Oscillospiraceae bacterium]